MKHISMRTAATLLVLTLTTLHNHSKAESINFIRTDTNNLSAQSGTEYTDVFTAEVLLDSNSSTSNTLATAGLVFSGSTANGAFQFLGQNQALCTTASSGSTYTPNITTAALANLGGDGPSNQLMGGASATANTVFQVQSAVDPNIDTIILTATIQLSTSATSITNVTNQKSRGKVGNFEVSVEKSDINLGDQTISVFNGDSLIFSEEISDERSVVFIIETNVSEFQHIPFECESSNGNLLIFYGVNWFEQILGANAGVTMSATGYDSSVDPPGFSGTRIFKQMIDEEEEEESPPVLIFDSESHPQ